MCFAVAFGIAAALACLAADTPAARWEGSVQIPGRDLKLIVDLAQDSEGQWTGSAIVPGFGVKGAPLTSIAVDGAAVAFTIKGALGEPRLTGHLTAAGSIQGDYQQAGNSAAFTLQKTGPPQVEPPRRSTPVDRELEGEWQGELELYGNKLRAKLTLANSGKAATAQFVIVGKRENKLPVELVIQEDDLLTIESPAFSATYEARFHRDTNEIAGTFRQGAVEASLTLRRGAAKP